MADETMGGSKRDMAVSSGMSFLAGTGLIAWGLTRESLLGKVLGVIPGAYLFSHGLNMARATREVSLPELEEARGVSLAQKVRIDRDARDIYAFCRDLENLPRFLTHTHNVREDADGTIHWVWNVPGGMRAEGDARLVDDEPGRVMTWVTLPDQPWEETGSILFEPVDGSTDVTLKIAWRFAGGMVGEIATRALSGYTEQVMRDELDSLKRMMEQQRQPVTT